MLEKNLVKCHWFSYIYGGVGSDSTARVARGLGVHLASKVLLGCFLGFVRNLSYENNRELLAIPADKLALSVVTDATVTLRINNGDYSAINWRYEVQ